MNKTLEITIPTNLGEVTLAQQKSLDKFMDGTKSEHEIALKMITILCNVDKEIVQQLKKTHVNAIQSELATILNQEATHTPRFEIDGVQYGFIPNLHEMTFSEFVDLDMYLKEEDSMHKVLSVFYRKIKHESFNRYEIEPYTTKEDMDIMYQAPLSAALGMKVFFYHLGKDLLEHTRKYLKEEMGKEKEHYLETFHLNGDGILASMHWQKETLLSSIESVN